MLTFWAWQSPGYFKQLFSLTSSFSTAPILQGCSLWLMDAHICSEPRSPSGRSVWEPLVPDGKLQWGNSSLGSHPGTGVLYRTRQHLSVQIRRDNTFSCGAGFLWRIFGLLRRREKLLKNPGKLFGQLAFLFVWGCLLLLSSWSSLLHHLLSLFLEVVLKFLLRSFHFLLQPAAILPPKKWFLSPVQTCWLHFTSGLLWKFLYVNLKCGYGPRSQYILGTLQLRITEMKVVTLTHNICPLKSILWINLASLPMKSPFLQEIKYLS